MLNPGGDIEDLYRDFAKNYPLKTDDSGWDDFLQKMENAPVKKLPPEKPAGGNPFVHMLKKYGYWLSAAALVAVLTGVFMLNSKKENNGPPAATTAAPVENSNTLPASKAKTAPSTLPAAEAGKNLPVTREHLPGGTAETASAKGAAQPSVTKADEPLNKSQQSNKTADVLGSLPAASGKHLSKNQLPANNNGNVAKQAVETTGSTAKNTIPSKPLQPAAAAQKDPAASAILRAQHFGDNNNAGSGETTIPKNANKTITGSTATNTKDIGVPDTSIVETNQQGNNKTGAIFQTSIRQPTMGDTVLQASQTQAPAVTPPSEVIAISPNMADAAPNQPKPVDSSNAMANSISPNSTPSIASLAASRAASNNNVDSAAAIQPVVKIKTREDKYFYAGISVGPDFSTVKFQPIQKTGSNVGLLLGVYLGHHLSIESGLLFSTKNYYTSGSYFKRAFNLPNDRIELTSVNANAKFLEIPISVRYDVIHKKRFKLFVNGGLSSYFTDYEHYDFLFHRPMGYENREEESDDVCANIFSLLHVSAGLEFKLTLHNVLRFEPYFKVPFSGVGVGSLPVTSSGFYINFTHSFLK